MLRALLRPPLQILLFSLLWLGLLAPVASLARESSASAAPAQVISLAELPAQGRETYQLILDGGPFPYAKDGTVFGNRERLLPAKPRGHYREYTVKTPRSRDRGARRIVCGGEPRSPSPCFYTDDHYASFKQIVTRP